MFWASWCHYCRAKLKEINSSPPREEDISTFFISIGEKESVVSRFAERMNFNPYITDNILLDTKGVLARKFGIIGIPFFVFLKEGRIVYEGYDFNEDLIKQFLQDE